MSDGTTNIILITSPAKFPIRSRTCNIQESVSGNEAIQYRIYGYASWRRFELSFLLVIRVEFTCIRTIAVPRRHLESGRTAKRPHQPALVTGIFRANSAGRAKPARATVQKRLGRRISRLRRTAKQTKFICNWIGNVFQKYSSKNKRGKEGVGLDIPE